MKRVQSDIPALYYPRIMEKNAVVLLSPEESQHLRALRRHAGDRVVLLDGQGTRAGGVIEGVGRDSVTVCIDSIVLDEAQSTPYIALGLGILADKARYEWCIEKGVELGAREFFPMITERSEGFLKAERAGRIAIAAMKQSQRSFLPVIHEPLSFAGLLEGVLRFERVVICHEKNSASISLVELLRSSPAAASTLILVGPEGGFSEDEVRVAADASAVAVSLGETRLRAETAALAALVIAVSLAR